MIFRADSITANKMTLLKVLHCGFSGSGKTTCAAKAPKVLILEPSQQAVPSIRAANPEALILPISDLDDLGQAYDLLREALPDVDGEGNSILVIRDGKEVYNIQSVVLDDFEEVQEHIKRDIQQEADTMTQKQWGLLNDRCMGWLRAFRNLPINFHLVCKVVRLQDDDLQVHELAVYGQKIKPALMGLFNCVGYHYKKTPTTEDAREFVVGFRLPEKFISKGHPALLPVEDPDPSVWLTKIKTWAGEITATPEQARPAQLPVEARMRRKAQQDGQNKKGR